MKPEDMMEKIRHSAESIVIPESLEPEKMMVTLEQSEVEGKSSEENQPDRKQTENDKADKKNLKFAQWFMRTGAVAAVFAVAMFLWEPIQRTKEGSLSQQNILNTTTDTTIGDTPDTTISDTPESSMSDAADMEETANSYHATSYKEIYYKIPKIGTEEAGAWREGAVSETHAAASSTGEMAAPSAGTGGLKKEDNLQMNEASEDFSDTNIQVAGVDEGDIVKTDGKYIYIADALEGTIRIVETDGPKLINRGELNIATLDRSGAPMMIEFYINGDKISVLSQIYNYGQKLIKSRIAHDFIYPDTPFLYLDTYDISDRSSPSLVGSVKQEGSYRSSRRVGDTIYLFSNYHADLDAKEEEIGDYIPKINDRIMPYESIYLPETIIDGQFLVASAVDMKKPDEVTDQKAIMSSGEHFYVSGEHIYIGTSMYDGKASQYDYTELMKLSYKEGKIELYAHGIVDGYLNNQFSMDEYEGNLRLVTTLSYRGGVSTNSLTILDEQLEPLGEIKDLAPNEKIYSARFMGDIAYFVTFRNMDPLFSADLSNPRKPRILGELKITGFSEYLHPYKDGLLLGIGQEIDPVTATFQGLKLSMFDTSNPKKVEETKKIVEKGLEYTPAWNNHKAVLISEQQNLLGFAVSGYEPKNREWFYDYVIYSYDEKEGFTKRMSYPIEDVSVDTVRGIYIGSWFYLVEDSRICVFTLDGFAQMGQLKY